MNAPHIDLPGVILLRIRERPGNAGSKLANPHRRAETGACVKWPVPYVSRLMVPLGGRKAGEDVPVCVAGFAPGDTGAAIAKAEGGNPPTVAASPAFIA